MLVRDVSSMPFNLIQSVDIEDFNPFGSIGFATNAKDNSEINNENDPSVSKERGEKVENKNNEEGRIELQKSTKDMSAKAIPEPVRNVDIIDYYLEDENGQIYFLKSGIIGNSLSADIKIMTSIFISRKHALVDFIGSKIFLQDLGSRNGTYVNGNRIRGDGKIQLKNGDSVTLGDTIFTVKH